MYSAALNYALRKESQVGHLQLTPISLQSHLEHSIVGLSLENNIPYGTSSKVPMGFMSEELYIPKRLR